MSNEHDQTGEPQPPKQDDEVGYCKPPKRTQFQTGNGGRPKGSGKRDSGLGGELRRTLKAPMKVRKQGGVVNMSVDAIIADCMTTLAASGDRRDIEALLRMVQRHLPELLAAPPENMQITYHRAEGSQVALPTDKLFTRSRT